MPSQHDAPPRSDAHTEALVRLEALSKGLARARTTDDVANAMLADGMAAMQADRASLAVVERDELNFIKVVGIPDVVIDRSRRLPLDAHTPASDCARTNEPVILADKATFHASYPELAGIQDELGISAWMSLPLAVEDRVVGVLGFAFDEDRTFDLVDESVANHLAELAALALDRARLASIAQRRTEDSLRQAAVALERERATVDLLQQAFLPHMPALDDVEVHATYRAAGSRSLVGGDWYDTFEIDDRHLAVVIGDVAGHGVVAAALMSQLRNYARVLLADGYAPDAALSTMNRLMGTSITNELATAILAVLDRSTRTLVWSSAGHPPLASHAPSKRTTIHQVRNGPPLGAIEGADYPLHSLELAADSVVVLYTDGLIERRDESIDEGLDRLATSLDDIVDNRDVSNGARWCDALCDAMLRGRDQRDDICVLALRLCGR